MLDILSCTIGGANMSDYRVIPNITVTAINAIKIFVPIILIVFGMIDLSKAVMSNDEKEMKGEMKKEMRKKGMRKSGQKNSIEEQRDGRIQGHGYKHQQMIGREKSVDG